ncbi:MAG: 2-dehydropantoate 2-reductase [Bermanella sp.]|jgi:2-dehydropantoate 2-reductase
MHDIYILGSGAMGSLWASYFHPKQSLHFIQRQASAEGYVFNILPSNMKIHGRSTQAQDIRSPIEYLIVATKAYDALEAISSVSQHLTSNSQVILLQNGLGSQQAISEAFPNIKLYGCSSTEGAYKKNAHTLVHAGKGTNSIGPLNHQATLTDLTSWLPDSQFEWHDDIHLIMWRKFMINCAINPLTVLYDCQNGELIKQDEYLAHMQRICIEIDAVTQRLHYPLASAFDLAKHVCALTSNNFSSMLQDKRNSQRTEIHFMTGYLLEQAKKLDIPCPENQKLFQTLTAS